MSRHDEPNEYGFAGDTTVPEPAPPHKRTEHDEAEEIAVPGSDLTDEISEAIDDTRGRAGDPPDPGDTGAKGN
jgi:hypothetical protein